MNEEFEALPFAAGETGAGEAEWPGEAEGEDAFEEERSRMPGPGWGGGRGGGMGGGRSVYRGGARPGRGPVARAARQQGRPGTSPRPYPRPYPGPHQGPYQGQYPGPYPGPRSRPRGPYWGPFYGGWPAGVMVSEPMGYPVPVQPEPIEPVDFPGPEEGDESQEIPPEFQATVDALTMPNKPAYQLVGSLMRSPGLLKPNKAGFYLIVFPAGGKDKTKFRAYSGHTDDLKRRMGEHILEVNRLGLRAPRHKVYVAETTLDEDGRRAIEYAIHDRMLRDHFGVLTNPRRELEAPAWF